MFVIFIVITFVDFHNFHSCTVHPDVIKVFYLPTDAQQSSFKRILKFTLKQLIHVSVYSPSSGSVLFELAKVTVIKINSSVVWLHILLGPYWCVCGGCNVQNSEHCTTHTTYL